MESGESPAQAALRETQEEIDVVVHLPCKIAELTFTFSHQPAWDQVVHVFVCKQWKGEPQETEEMRPQWFSLDTLPWDDMWPDDRFWLPLVLEGNLVQGSFVFGKEHEILTQEVRTVDYLFSPHAFRL